MARHLNIGAGRIVWQDIVRIDVSIKKRQFHKSPNIVQSMQRAKDGNGRLHLLGLVSYPPFCCGGMGDRVHNYLLTQVEYIYAFTRSSLDSCPTI